MEDQHYQDLKANPSLRRLIGDCDSALTHLGYYLGFLLYEVGRKDWKNAVLILTVRDLVNGELVLLQNWKWALGSGMDATFNTLAAALGIVGRHLHRRCGIAYFLVAGCPTRSGPSSSPQGHGVARWLLDTSD